MTAMAISEAARKCVVFLGYPDGVHGTNRIIPRGTGFFVHGGKLLGGGSYLVTARHVAEKLDPPFVIRLNKKGGGADVIEVDRSEHIRWRYHSDSTVDLAVAPLDPPQWADVIHFSVDHFLREMKLKSKNIGPGDTTYTVGLFSPSSRYNRKPSCRPYRTRGAFPWQRAHPCEDPGWHTYGS